MEVRAFLLRTRRETQQNVRSSRSSVTDNQGQLAAVYEVALLPHTALNPVTCLCIKIRRDQLNVRSRRSSVTDNLDQRAAVYEGLSAADSAGVTVVGSCGHTWGNCM
ncbi:hypothetical protein J6590_098174 [Homalodisca vitripennis]|nr:hypothetical protein J6590_098174 [Homalodisca vitripennis]